MHLHEFQIKALLQTYGVPTPEVIVCTDEKQVALAIEKMDLKKAVLKAQVHSAQRKKYGGILFAQTPDEIYLFSRKLLHMRFTSHQIKDVPVEKILIAPMIEIEKEYYISLVIDQVPILLASKHGGSDVESAESIKIPLRFDGKIYDFQLFSLIKVLEIPLEQQKTFCTLIKKLCYAFSQMEAVLLEINPLALTKTGFFLALDAKCTVDDNALFRHVGIAAYFDPTQLPFLEAEAYREKISYVSFEGKIGCLFNGAGLAMATLDEIVTLKGSVANFLDIGGDFNLQSIRKGLGLIIRDPQVKGILINLFDSVVDGRLISETILNAIDEFKIDLPMVVRFEGNHSEDAKHILRTAHREIDVANSLEEAVIKVINRTKE